MTMKIPPNTLTQPLRALDADLRNSTEVMTHIQCRSFALALYAALCNNLFYHEDNTITNPIPATLDTSLRFQRHHRHENQQAWTCTWRTAGAIVAELRGQANRDYAGEDYLDYYCHGHESEVRDDIRDLLQGLGWVVRPYPKVSIPDISILLTPDISQRLLDDEFPDGDPHS